MRSRANSTRPDVWCPLCKSPQVRVWPAAIELNVFICECGECQALFSVSPKPYSPSAAGHVKTDIPRGRDR